MFRKIFVLLLIMSLSAGCWATTGNKAVAGESGNIESMQKVERVRFNFKSNLKENANYYGTVQDFAKKAVVVINQKMTYEELTCVGLYPDRNLLEAVIKVKLPYGFQGKLCSNGSKEYVAFYIDYGDGNGWIKSGATVNVGVHDIPAVSNGPLFYALKTTFEPKQLLSCSTPQVVKVRAILAWEQIPNNPNFTPVWGNRMDRHVLIKPRPSLSPVVVWTMKEFNEKLKIFKELPLQNESKLNPFVIDPPPPPEPIWKEKYVMMGDKDQIKEYLQSMEKSHAENRAAQGVEKERGDFPQLISKNINYFGGLSKSKNPVEIMAAVNKLSVQTSEKLFVGSVNPAELVPVFPMFGNTAYEELKCVGLYPEEDLLEAVLEIKRSYGYAGGLCPPGGGNEYVAFYIDWGDGNGYVPEGTASVKVHDIPAVTTGKHLFYAVRLQIGDIAQRLLECSTPNIVKVKAVLSWYQDPTGLGVNYIPSWGNILERRIQIRPFNTVSTVKITSVNDIIIPHIEQTGVERGYAINPESTASVYRYDKPFGGVIACHGDVNISGAGYYRFLYQEGAGWSAITDPWRVPNPLYPFFGPLYYNKAPDVNGWFKITDYINALGDNPALRLVYWRSYGKDSLVKLKLEVADNTPAKNVLQTDEVYVKLDNSAPKIYSFSGTSPNLPASGVLVRDLNDASKKCDEFVGHDQIRVYANFDDQHFGGYSLVVFGGNITSAGSSIGKGDYDAINNQGRVYDRAGGPYTLNPVLSLNINSKGIIGAADNTMGKEIRRLDLCDIPQSPVKVRCAYGVRLYISDRTIVGRFGSLGYNYSAYSGHGANAYVTFNWDPAGCN